LNKKSTITLTLACKELFLFCQTRDHQINFMNSIKKQKEKNIF